MKEGPAYSAIGGVDKGAGAILVLLHQYRLEPALLLIRHPLQNKILLGESAYHVVARSHHNNTATPVLSDIYKPSLSKNSKSILLSKDIGLGAGKGKGGHNPSPTRTLHPRPIKAAHLFGTPAT